MNGRTNNRLWAVCLSVFVAGTVACAWAWGVVVDQGHLLPTVGAFALAFVVAEAMPVRIRQSVDVALSSAVIFTALLVGGPPVAIGATVGALVVGWHRYGGGRLQKHIFNFGQLSLSATAAAMIFVLLGGHFGAADVVNEWTTWVALIASAAVYTLVNHSLVAVPIRLASGERIRSTLKSVLASSMTLQVLYAGLAVLAAALILLDPWTILFLILPALVARHALLGYQREAEAYDRLVGALLKAIEVKDGYTAVHTERVSQLCVEVAREYGLEYNELRAVRYAAKLHDVGKLAVPQSIINKPAKLDNDEFELIKKHPTVGADILAEIEFLEPIIDGVRYHHERVDGDGYPFGLAGDEVPLLARIITVCDAFDAMTTTRSYRQAMEIDEAFDELYRCAGTQFDRDVVMVLEQVTQRLGWEPTREAYTPETSSLDEVGR